MKIPVHATLDAENMDTIDRLVKSGKYRSRSHALDEALKLLLKELRKKETVKL